MLKTQMQLIFFQTFKNGLEPDSTVVCKHLKKCLNVSGVAALETYSIAQRENI